MGRESEFQAAIRSELVSTTVTLTLDLKAVTADVGPGRCCSQYRIDNMTKVQTSYESGSQAGNFSNSLAGHISWGRNPRTHG